MRAFSSCALGAGAAPPENHDIEASNNETLRTTPPRLMKLSLIEANIEA